MSTTLTKRLHADALRDAEAFRDLFDKSSYDRWEFAGSVRRRKEEIGDVEHVVIARRGDVETGDGLFKLKQEVNLVWYRMQRMLEHKILSKHIYGTTGPRWGEKFRGADFRGFNHEVSLVDAQNFGSMFVIKTGPAELSQRMVTLLKRAGNYRHDQGYVRDIGGNIVPMPDEQTFFTYCGVKYIEPEARR